MFYAIVLIVIFFIILFTFLIRLANNSRHRSHLRAASASPETIQREAPRPTFRDTARGVGDRVFGTGVPVGHGEGVWATSHRPSMTIGEGVNRDRDLEAGDLELPSYHDSTTISVPPAAYSSPIQARRDGRTMMDLADQPPKYDFNQALPPSSAPPIVRQL